MLCKLQVNYCCGRTAAAAGPAVSTPASASLGSGADILLDAVLMIYIAAFSVAALHAHDVHAVLYNRYQVLLLCCASALRLQGRFR